MSVTLRPDAARQAELQTQKLMLENQALLPKATPPDGGAAPTQLQAVVDEALEEVSTQLQKAKAAPRLDSYQALPPAPAPGAYTVEPDPAGYRISFQPYSEG